MAKLWGSPWLGSGDWSVTLLGTAHTVILPEQITTGNSFPPPNSRLAFLIYVLMSFIVRTSAGLIFQDKTVRKNNTRCPWLNKDLKMRGGKKLVKNLSLGFLCGIQKADENEMTPFNVKNQIRIRRSRWRRFWDKRQCSPCSGGAHVSPSGSSVFATHSITSSVWAILFSLAVSPKPCREPDSV